MGSYLYVFGAMFVIMEVLRSTIQEPVFFILFQPLSPHERLRGHLIAKGYTLPVALLIAGTFFMFYQQLHSTISIPAISKLLIIFLVLWIAVVIMIKNQYIRTLIHSIKKGYFTGQELFLNDATIFNLLIEKTKSKTPLEVIHALNLLERSGYNEISKLLLTFLQETDNRKIKEYVVERIVSKNITGALPVINKQIKMAGDPPASLYKALFFLEEANADGIPLINSLHDENKKAALTGLLLKKDDYAQKIVDTELIQLAKGRTPGENQLAIEVISDAGEGDFSQVLQILLNNSNRSIFQQAIEIAGKVKDYSIFNAVLQTTGEKFAYYAFQKSLIYYGDDIFDEKYLPVAKLPDKILHHVIKAASNVKGDRSDKFLIELLKNGHSRQDEIMEALWQKKASLQKSSHVESWIKSKLESMKIKVNYFLNLHHSKQAHLLENALQSEIEQNVETVLKACFIVFGKEEINRFIEIYKLENSSKVANAMELLELTIPRKYFTPLCNFIEISQDLKKKQQVMQGQTKMEAAGILKEVISNTHANFNSWSKSVAFYLLPQLYKRDAAVDIAKQSTSEDDVIVKETKEYVVSMLK